MFSTIHEFQWDEGNLTKNGEKHHVSYLESEQTFFNQPLIVQKDVSHSQSENRWFLLGKTDTERLLMIIFTARKKQIRVISARPMSRKERKIYEQNT